MWIKLIPGPLSTHLLPSQVPFVAPQSGGASTTAHCPAKQDELDDCELLEKELELEEQLEENAESQELEEQDELEEEVLTISTSISEI